MATAQQFEDCFELQLAVPKVTHIFFLNTHTLLLLHIPNLYTIISIPSRDSLITQRQSRFPFCLIEDIKVVNQRSILFVHNNKLVLFDLYRSQVLSSYAIAESQIYEQQFQLDHHQPSANFVLFYKTSLLKSSPLTFYYQLHLLEVKEEFHLSKKMKNQQQQLFKFTHIDSDIVFYQVKGYTIEICFLEGNLKHKINSIYYLTLVYVQSRAHHLLLHFTHEQLENELATYEVAKGKLRKTQRTIYPLQPHTYHNYTGSRSIVYKNHFNHRRKDHFSAIFRVKVPKAIKYLRMMESVLPSSVDKSFRQQILNLLV